MAGKDNAAAVFKVEDRPFATIVAPGLVDAANARFGCGAAFLDVIDPIAGYHGRYQLVAQLKCDEGEGQ